MSPAPTDDCSGTTDLLPRNELKRRASGGLFFVSSWGLLTLVVGFVGNLLLARMLVPTDFGLVAIGATLMVFATALSDGGLGSGLIRRARPPDRRELRAVLAIQLTLTLILAVAVAAVASGFGKAGLVVAIMMAGLPFAAFQTPGKVLLSRALRFQRLALIDAISIVVFYLWAVTGVLAGLGVWAMATGAVARALAGSIVALRLSGIGFLPPSFAGSRALAPLVRFGVRFQAVSFTNVAREQGVNALTAAIAGVSALGLWTLARRLLEMPLLMFESLWRVSFPVMSQLLARREDPAPLIERSLALSSIVAGLILSSVAGAAPEFVPSVFGAQWRETGLVVAVSCVPLLIAGPLSVSTIGYLYAAGNPSSVLRATFCQTLILFVIAFPLLPIVGVVALPVGWFAGAVVEAIVLGRATAKLAGARIVRPLAAPIISALMAGTTGAWIAARGNPGLVSGLMGGGVAIALYVSALMVLRREQLFEVGRVLADSIRAAMSRRPPLSAGSAAQASGDPAVSAN